MSKLDRLIRNLDAFPTINAVAQKVVTELSDEECALEHAAELISRDALMTARMLRVSSSPIYLTVHPITSIEQAIMRLGIKETRNIALSIAIVDALPDLPEPLTLESFWTMGYGTALSARQLAKDIGYEDSERAYLAGLVHSLGEAYLAIEHTDRYRAALERARAAEMSYEAGLIEEFGVPHSAVAAEVLQRWNLPELVVDAVRHHLEPSESKLDVILPAIVFAADRICRDLQLAAPDAGHKERAWVEEIPAALMERIDAIGYPDITFYLLEQREFLVYVGDTVRSTFGSS